MRPGKRSHKEVFTSQRSLLNEKDTNGPRKVSGHIRCSHLRGVHNERFHYP